MASRWAWAVVGWCAACGGSADEQGVEVPSGGWRSFPVRSEMVSQRGTENAACFGEPGPDGPGEPSCELTQSLRLKDIRFDDGDGDSKVEPGETLRLFVELAAEP